MIKKRFIPILVIVEGILILFTLYLSFFWIKADKLNFEPKIVFLATITILIGFLINRILKKEDNMDCPYNSEGLHKNIDFIVNTTLDKLQVTLFKEQKKDLKDIILLEKIGDIEKKLPVVMLIKKEITISKVISNTLDKNKIDINFIEILKNKCKRKIWNNDTYRVMSIDEEDNQLRLGKSDYYKTLSTCDLHYYNFMKSNNQMVQCLGDEYNQWFKKLENIVIYNELTTVSASLGCSTLLVIKNYDTKKYQYYIVDNSIAKNPANTKHVVPSFMFQPTTKITNREDFQLQSDIQTQVLKEFGEELLGMKELEKISTERELKLLMQKNPTLKKLKKLLKEGNATLKILGISLDIFRLRPELLTVLVIEDKEFYNNFLPKMSWEVSLEDKNGLGIYNIDDEEQYLKLIFDDEKPLVSPATACLKLGREFILSKMKKGGGVTKIK